MQDYGNNQDKKEDIKFEEVLDTEIDDIWEIFFPYMTEKKENFEKEKDSDKGKARRYLKFLTM